MKQKKDIVWFGLLPVPHSVVYIFGFLIMGLYIFVFLGLGIADIFDSGLNKGNLIAVLIGIGLLAFTILKFRYDRNYYLRKQGINPSN